MKKIGRTLRTLVILFLVILGITVIIANLIKKVIDYEDEINVIVYAENIDKGKKVERENISILTKQISIAKSDVPENAILDANNILGFYVQEDVYKGEFLTKNTIDEKYPFHVEYDIPEGHSLVSVKFEQGDAANAWNVFEQQEITLVYTPAPSALIDASTANKYVGERLIDGTIYSIKDSQYKMPGEADYDPSKLLYITFLVKKQDAIFITHVKDKGRLDIIQ